MRALNIESSHICCFEFTHVRNDSFLSPSSPALLTIFLPCTGIVVLGLCLSQLCLKVIAGVNEPLYCGSQDGAQSTVHKCYLGEWREAMGHGCSTGQGLNRASAMH